MGHIHSIQKFNRTEWVVANREGYICTVNLIELGPTCSCNLPQLQKMPRAHVIAACANDCVNISTYAIYTE